MKKTSQGETEYRTTALEEERKLNTQKNSAIIKNGYRQDTSWDKTLIDDPQQYGSTGQLQKSRTLEVMLYREPQEAGGPQKQGTDENDNSLSKY